MGETDLISKQATIDKINERQRKLIYCFGFENDMVKIMDIAKSIIIAMPSAQPERKKGKWIYKNDLKQFFCSECGYPSLTYDDTYIYGMDLPNYCEDCGADMRGEQE